MCRRVNALNTGYGKLSAQLREGADFRYFDTSEKMSRSAEPSGPLPEYDDRVHPAGAGKHRQ
jgi:hypothetical protein